MLNQPNPSWQDDEITEQPAIPSGVIGTCDKIPNAVPMVKELGNLPVIVGHFDARKWDASTELPESLYLEVEKLGKTQALKVCIQRGPNVIYWFANLADKKVWETLDTWDTRGTMAVAVFLDDGTVNVASQPFKLHPELNALRETIVYSGAATFLFILATIAQFVTDGYRKRVVSVHREYPELQHVQACMLTTENTGGAAVASHD